MVIKSLVPIAVLAVAAFAMEHEAMKKQTKSKQRQQGLSEDLDEFCPRSCRCPTAEKVDCSDAKLKIVPHNISRDAVYLLLNENRLSEITPECFRNCPHIRMLNLQGNKISDRGISDHAFESLSHLKHLYLSENKLKKTPALLPDGLVSLNLEGNAISRVDGSSFAQKTQMKHLYLHDNKLTAESFSSIDFSNMTSVQEVTLSNNLLKSIPNLPDSVEWLHLRNNGISEIPGNSFQAKKNLLALYVQNNELTDDGLLPTSFIGLNKLEALDLSGNKLSLIPAKLPRRLKVLDLKKNDITKITKKSLAHLKESLHASYHTNFIRRAWTSPILVTAVPLKTSDKEHETPVWK